MLNLAHLVWLPQKINAIGKACTSLLIRHLLLLHRYSSTLPVPEVVFSTLNSFSTDSSFFSLFNTLLMAGKAGRIAFLSFIQSSQRALWFFSLSFPPWFCIVFNFNDNLVRLYKLLISAKGQAKVQSDGVWKVRFFSFHFLLLSCGSALVLAHASNIFGNNLTFEPKRK